MAQTPDLFSSLNEKTLITNKVTAIYE